MESQPQNPELRNNPENFNPYTMYSHKIFFYLIFYVPANNFSIMYTGGHQRNYREIA